MTSPDRLSTLSRRVFGRPVISGLALPWLGPLGRGQPFGKSGEPRQTRIRRRTIATTVGHAGG